MNFWKKNLESQLEKQYSKQAPDLKALDAESLKNRLKDLESAVVHNGGSYTPEDSQLRDRIIEQIQAKEEREDLEKAA